MDFLEWLNLEMEKKKWSSNKLAKECGVSHTAMANLISGKQKATFDMCHKIAGAFNMPAEEVFRIAGLLPRIHHDKKEIQYVVDRLNQLPKHTLRDIADFVDYKYKKEKGGGG